MGGNGIGRREHSFFSIPLKPQIFIPLKLGGMGGNEIRFNDFFFFLLKLLKYPNIFNPLF